MAKGKIKKRLTQDQEFQIMKLVLDKFLWLGFLVLAYAVYLGVILAYMMRTSQSGDAPQSWLAHQKDLQFARRAWPDSLLARRRTHTNLQQQDGKSTRQNCLTNWLCGY